MFVAMGGWGSGRQGGRPVAEHCLRVELPWMLRTGRIVPGQHIRSSLHWSRGGDPSGSISYEAIMSEPGSERLILIYTRGSGADKESVRQEVRLVSTPLNYGGRRWWMICPYRGERCTKLFMPSNGDRFASRKAWRIAYKSQRGAWHDKPFGELERLQRKLGSPEGFEEPLRRPKGMWHRTFARHEARYWQINDRCDQVWVSMMGRLGIIRDRLA